MAFVRRYGLALLSGVALALAFFPFYLWPLAFVALAPFFYFAAGAHRSRGQIFIGGFLTGLIGIGPLVYLSLAQLTLFPDAEAFTFLIRASSVPVALFTGALFGLLALAYAALRIRSAALNALVGASLYFVLIEMPLQWFFDGYYYGAFSHATASFGASLAAASLGGAALASWLVALCSAVLGEAGCAYKSGHTYFFLAPLLVALTLAVLWAEHHFAPVAPSGEKELQVAVVQGTAEDYAPNAADDLVVYPFSFTVGVAAPAEDKAIGERLAVALPASTTAVLWQTLEVNGLYYDELAAWQNGIKTVYRKRELYALSDDYTPQWLKSLGIEKSPFGVTAGEGGIIEISGILAGALLCSELHQAPLARQTASASSLMLAVGSDNMFPGSLSGNFSLAAARLRAAESGIPLVRANQEGPSAFIAHDGSLEASLAYGERGVLQGSVAISRVQTLYARVGDAPVGAIVFIVLVLASTLSWRREPTAPGRSVRD